MNNSAPRLSNLRKAREARRQTQAEMAEVLGVTPGWYGLVERHPRFLSERLAVRAAQLLGVPIEELRR